MDQVRHALRVRHYSRSTERAYVGWIRRYIYFHGRRHPREMGEKEVTQFLSNLAVRGRVSASTQNQALSALLFLYGQVLQVDLPWMAGIMRGKRALRVPVVLTRHEVGAVLGELTGTKWLAAALLYGSGLRLMECLRMRVKDIDFERGEITVRSGKGRKDRVTMLAGRTKEPLRTHLEKVRRLHEADLRRGRGSVELPYALERKYPTAAWEWGWQWVFPATASTRTGRARCGAGTICMHRSSRGPCMRPRGARGSRSP